ncbi:MAG: hypothetical protein RMJ07_05020 [Nitrososphaerota archaeon]|nr:hypothetical protein [Candidatus Bathyarchaeota archaeon]MDW8049027.1 hypothetical protein [Nitrososphaerota archaeon]
MSTEDKQRFEEFLRRVDELLSILKFLSEDLSEISKNLKRYLAAPTTPDALSGHPASSVVHTNVIQDQAPSPTALERRTAMDVQKAFPEDLWPVIYFEEDEEYVLVKPRQYLGADNFRRIATIVRDQLGGEYVSAGKDSHFRVPRKP